VARCLHYARPGGLATAFVTDGEGQSAHQGRGVAGALVPGTIGVALGLGMAVAGRGAHGLAAMAGELAAIALVVVFAQRRIGGFTGDVLGAAGVVGETVGLLVLAAKW
jgi:adenosylcobinamide-GDP ribazoletransferase